MVPPLKEKREELAGAFRFESATAFQLFPSRPLIKKVNNGKKKRSLWSAVLWSGEDWLADCRKVVPFHVGLLLASRNCFSLSSPLGLIYIKSRRRPRLETHVKGIGKNRFPNDLTP